MLLTTLGVSNNLVDHVVNHVDHMGGSNNIEDNMADEVGGGIPRGRPCLTLQKVKLLVGHYKKRRNTLFDTKHK